MEASVGRLDVRGWTKPFSRDGHGFMISVAAWRAPEGKPQARETYISLELTAWWKELICRCVRVRSLYGTSLLPTCVVPFILAPFSLLLSIAPGKQTRRRLHIHGRWVNPVVLSSHLTHKTFQVPAITRAFGLVLNTYKVQTSMS